MRRLSTLNLAQRIILVVALAAGLRTTWVYLFCRSGGAEGGWFSYAPLAHETYVGSGSNLASAFFAIAFIALWAVASIWLLGLSDADAGRPPKEPDPS